MHEGARGWGLAVVLGVVGADGLLAAQIDESKLPPAAVVKVEFARDIKPILTNICYRCHSGEKPKSHFLLTTRENALKGGNYGVDIIPGQSAKSPLIHYVSRVVKDMEMPPEGKAEPLTKEQIGLLRAWIDQGVVWEQAQPENKTEATATPVVGWTGVSGDSKKFRELNWQHEGWNGGLEDFALTEKLKENSTLTLNGHVLLNDYKLALGLTKTDFGFANLGWSQYRKYYDDTGGYYQPFSPPSFNLDRDLYKDIGRAWADFGLTLPQWPRLVLGYEFQTRDGSEAMLQWGPVYNGVETRDIYPAFKNLSEKVHILKFDADYETGGWLATDSFRGEWYSLTTDQFNDTFYTIGAAGMASTQVKGSQSHFQGANTVHLENQFTDWLFAAGGYLYSKFNGDAAVNVDTSQLSFIPSFGIYPVVLPVWNAQGIELQRESHVFSVSAMVGPWEGLTMSLSTQNEWTRQTGFGEANVAIVNSSGPSPVGLSSYQSDLDRSTFSQNAQLRFVKIPFTTLFAEARFQQESIGQFQEDTGGLNPFLLNTEAQSWLQNWRTGFNTSPWRRVALSAHYLHYQNHSDYDNTLKALGPGLPPYAGYPGFIRWRNLTSNEAEARLSLQVASWLKTTFSYRWLDNDYDTATDPVADPISGVPGGITPGTGLLAGQYQAHIGSVNATMTPWRRLYLSATLTGQNARTVTSANGSPSVAPYAGDIFSVGASASYILTDKTDLTASYVFSTADFAQDNVAAGLPLGINYQQQALQAGIKHRLSKDKTVSLQYRFYHYDEPTSGSVNNYNAQGVFAALSMRLP
jgi:hypothetical protein